MASDSRVEAFVDAVASITRWGEPAAPSSILLEDDERQHREMLDDLIVEARAIKLGERPARPLLYPTERTNR